jgi:hypothetical protein
VTSKQSDRLPIVGGYERDAGFVRLWRELMTCYGRRLGLEPIALWAFLRDHIHRPRDVGGGLAWVGYRLIAATFGLTDRRTIRGYLDALDHAGLVQRRAACEVVPDVRDRRDLGINDRAIVYRVNDPPDVWTFAALTFGRDCIDCPFLAGCEAGRSAIGAAKIPGLHSAGEVSPGGGVKITPRVVEKSHHNKTNTSSSALPSALAERMSALKVKAKTQERLARQYDFVYLERKIALLESQIATVDKPEAWLVAACRDDYLPSPGGLRNKAARAKRGGEVKPPKILKTFE